MMDEEYYIPENTAAGTSEYAAVYYNGSDGCEAGPYLIGWYTSKAKGDAAVAAFLAASPPYDGWHSRTDVLHQDEYFSSI
jgi:hypothetical protein